MKDDQDDGYHEKRVDPIPSARQSWADPLTKKAEQPEDDEYQYDGPNHDISP